MHLSPWTVYWITRATAIGNVATGLAITSGVVFTLCAIITLVNLNVADEYAARRQDGTKPTIWSVTPKSFKKLLRWSTSLCAGLTLIATLTPTTKEMCAILVVPAIANSQDVQALGGDIVTLAREWLQELKPHGSEESR